jgi:2-polyprenyl-3-methyl-5-hydroxy-6-metoxy-1,4-benzoquinol methylase
VELTDNRPMNESDLVQFASGVLTGEPDAAKMINEARVGLSRLLPILLAPPIEVLEVGAGHCILSAYLARCGYRVTALEPMGDEFKFFSGMQRKMVSIPRQSRGL